MYRSTKRNSKTRNDDRGEKRTGDVPEEEDGHIQAGCGSQCEEEPHVAGVPGRLGVPCSQFIRHPASATHAFPQNKNKTLRLLALVEGKFEGGVSRAALWTCIFTGFQV